MANSIKHQGIVESTTGSHVLVRIIQTSACASCSIKGHCTSADAKEKRIDIMTADASSYRPGDCVWVLAGVSMGAIAVWWAFILPFLVVVASLFIFMSWWQNELYAALGSLFLLIPYYYMLRLNRSRLMKKFSFSIRPMD